MVVNDGYAFDSLGKLGSGENILVVYVADDKHCVGAYKVFSRRSVDEDILVYSERLKLIVGDVEAIRVLVCDDVYRNINPRAAFLFHFLNDRHCKARHSDTGAYRVKVGGGMSHNKDIRCAADLVFKYFSTDARDDSGIVFDGFVSTAEENISRGILSPYRDLVSSALYCHVQCSVCIFFLLAECFSDG